MARGLALALSVCAACAAGRATAQDGKRLPERVTFLSADGHTTLVGYLYSPNGRDPAPAPAVVMLHGRAGPYSSAARGRYDASTLSQRNQMWGMFWAARGFAALLVDSFGPRGYPRGFPRFSYDDRPAEVGEVEVRPLDAYGALAYLRSRPDVAADRIALQGWSNGGSAALVTMSVGAPRLARETPASGFRVALVFYPACGLQKRFDREGYLPYAPVRIFHGTADDEVSYRPCRALVERSQAVGGDIDIRLYPDATHGFDDPGRRRQSNEANAAAKEDSMRRAARLFAQFLR